MTYRNPHNQWNHGMQQPMRTPQQPSMEEQVYNFLHQMGHNDPTIINEMINLLRAVPPQQVNGLLQSFVQQGLNPMQQLMELRRMIGGGGQMGYGGNSYQPMPQQQQTWGNQVQPRVIGGGQPSFGQPQQRSGALMPTGRFSRTPEEVETGSKSSSGRFAPPKDQWSQDNAWTTQETKTDQEEAYVEEDTSSKMNNGCCEKFDVRFSVNDENNMPVGMTIRTRRLAATDVAVVEGSDGEIIVTEDLSTLCNKILATMSEEEGYPLPVVISEVFLDENVLNADNRLTINDLLDNYSQVDEFKSGLESLYNTTKDKDELASYEALNRMVTKEVNFLVRYLGLHPSVRVPSFIHSFTDLCVLLQENDTSHPEDVKLLAKHIEKYLKKLSVGEAGSDLRDGICISEVVNALTLYYLDKELGLDKIKRDKVYCLGLSSNNAFIQSLGMYIDADKRNFIVTRSRSVFRMAVRDDNIYIQRV